jgi:glycosyltransferase involved in cell wall biosynthesis
LSHTAIRKKIYVRVHRAYITIEHVIGKYAGDRVRRRVRRWAFLQRAAFFPRFDFQFENNQVSSPNQNQNVDREIPNWVLRDMTLLGAKLEPELYPTTSLKATYRSLPAAIVVAPGHCYEKILRACDHSEYPIVFIVPWLTHGGADKEAIDLINSVCKIRTDPVLVILSEAAESPWRARLDKSANVVSLNGDFHEIPVSEQMLVLATLVQNVKCTHLHVINSKTGWALIKTYGKALSQNIKISAHLFCESVGEHGELYGYASDYLRSSYLYMTNIFTDSQYMIDQMTTKFAIPRSLFQLLRQRVNPTQHIARRLSESSRILWAGRLDRQKLPDILLRIAKLLPMVTFDVYGRSVLDDTSLIVNELTALPNVIVHGEYEYFDQIVNEQHCVFLYTSAWDGYPNVLIEAGQAGLPIVASAVGGIPEIINESSGYLVPEHNLAESYVARISAIFDHYEEAIQRARQMHDIIIRNFDAQLFDSKVAEYFSDK